MSGVSGRKAFDKRIYAAGVVLAEMLGARLPLRLTDLARDLPGVSGGLKVVLERACAHEPDARYLTADAFLAGLDALMGPRAVGILDPQLVICPNMRCSGVARSGGGSYVFGPKIVGPTTDPFCANCGSEYIRGCSCCGRPLPENIASLVCKATKPEPDAIEAHCSRCGTTIFVTPTCKKCGSYLKPQDIGNDTSTGCSKCNPAWAKQPYGSFGSDESSGPKDDDIPF